MSCTQYDPINLVSDRFRRDKANVASFNERAVLAEVWRDPGLSRSALQSRLDLTQQSVHRLVTQLQDRRMIRLGALCPPVYKGKPSPALYLDESFGCTIGVSVDTDSASVAVMRFDGQSTSSRMTIAGMSMQEALSRIDTAIDALLRDTSYQRADVIGLGLAISGFKIDGSRYNTPEPLVEWSAVDLGPFVSDALALPVWTENGANCSAVCELMFGVGRHVSNFVYLSFNYGFGAGLVMDGRLQTGGFGNAGELSGMFTPEEMPNRPMLSSLIEELRLEGLDLSNVEDLSEAFDVTHPAVIRWIERILPQHNRVVNTLSAVVDPQCIVYGGQVPRELAKKLIARSEDFGEERHGISRRRPEEVVSQLGTDTAAVGAASLPLKGLYF